MFAEGLDDLYQLSLLMTGDHERAEQCFVGGLEDCLNANGVFRDWARSWAKRIIIQTAIRESGRNPGDAGRLSICISTHMCDFERERRRHFAVAAVLALEDFERFVFVMSVLESYSEHDCALLLSCTIRQVNEARSRALARLMGSCSTVSSSEIRVDEVPG